MESQWIIDRATLRRLMTDHPTWTNQQYANRCGRCKSWVKKWKKRLQGTALDDDAVLRSYSRARRTAPESYHPDVIERILALRDHPPKEVSRKLGPLPILYYLHRDHELKAKGYRLPRSSSTVWKILDRHQRIIRQPTIISSPFERPEPMDTWEIDFTDVAGARAAHDHKRMHQVEAFAVVDRGTSILVDLQSSDSYQSASVLVAMASTLLQQGRPRCIVFDRDPRFVGSWSAGGFPSAFMRFLLCLGIAIEVCPPQRPDLKPFVERYFRTLNSECVLVKRPVDAKQASEIFDDHRYVYNHQRPNQSCVCGNQPPYQAFTSLPRLPHIPSTIDPDAWLSRYHNRQYKRRVDHAGRIKIDKHPYYVRRTLAGHYIVGKLEAPHQVLHIHLEGKLLKSIPIKGLYNEPMPFDVYLRLMMKEAEAEQQRLARKRRLQAA